MAELVQGAKRISIGILAHVDAGKTTLSEGLLYESGAIRKYGRVDDRDAFLDHEAIERERGITVFSKQAMLELGDTTVTLLDTPGHADFGAEMERCLQVLDYAVLLISAADGVQGRTQTLWKLLKRYQVPTFVFVNKMDQVSADRDKVYQEIHDRLSTDCIDFSSEYFDTDACREDIAQCSEELMEAYLESGMVPSEGIAKAIYAREIFPVLFGSALKRQGVRELLDLIGQYGIMGQYPDEFGARVYKISRDEQGVRQTHLKITGGALGVRELIEGEKVNQIRLYSGEKYSLTERAGAGSIVAVTGLNNTRPGQGIGIEKNAGEASLVPVLSYRVILPDGVDALGFLPKIRMIEEEEPGLCVVWQEETSEILVKLMGRVQIEILSRQIMDRFGIEVSFDKGRIVYQETIADVVEGVGHFEPLRHYAEVHLKLEPGDRGSGLTFAADCREEILQKNWQRLILTHLEEREHRGVLTGAGITDVKITVIGGRAHTKHTEGGDFRQATYRAIRQGLMQATNMLLEPYYDFELTIPSTAIGRAMTDLEAMSAHFEAPETYGEMVSIKGYGPVSTLRDYTDEIVSYTKGFGHMECSFRGYDICHNAEEIVETSTYNPELDLRNTPDSVFCSHGAGVVVPWNEVFNYMHVEPCLNQGDAKPYVVDEESLIRGLKRQAKESSQEIHLGTDEIDAILRQTYDTNRRNDGDKRYGYQHSKGSTSVKAGYTRDFDKVTMPGYLSREKKKEYILIDGYNVIYAWSELSQLIAQNVDSARDKLLDILCDYQAFRGGELIVVFDAYRVKNHATEYSDYHNIHVVYTAEAETADHYIERFAHENGRKYDVTVVTSDGMEQIIIRGQGARLISSREFEVEVARIHQEKMEAYQQKNVRDEHIHRSVNTSMQTQLEKLKLSEDEGV